VWGEERLRKHQASDTKKVSMLLSDGYNILRVKQLTKTLSDKKKRDTLKAILDVLPTFSLTTRKLVEIEA
jgi:very-short-patch-repair endonuclease